MVYYSKYLGKIRMLRTKSMLKSVNLDRYQINAIDSTLQID